MAAAQVWPFRSAANHEAISALIRRRSTNKVDVRDAVLDGLDLSGTAQVLDLGCGFGFMGEAVARRVAPDATMVGVDVWSENQEPYLARIVATGRKARFFCASVGDKFPCPDRNYDLVICSYSLYFFPDALAEVARVLKRDGLFLAITHSTHSFTGLYEAVGMDAAQSELSALAQRFSAENGAAVLDEWFGEVVRIDYRNTLRFEAEDMDDLLAYLKFKLPLLIPEATPESDLPQFMEAASRQYVRSRGAVVVDKTDAAFRCRSPRCP